MGPSPTCGAPPSSQPTVAPHAGPGRVLVIDDERAILRIVSRILSPANHVVVTTSVREALGLLRSGQRFDVILSDLMLPDLTGMDLYDELVATSPDDATRVIFLTGGAITAETRAFLERVPSPHLEKPFDPRELARLVSERVRDAQR